MTKAVLIHGNGAGNNGREIWFPSVKRALEAEGVRCETPDMPDAELARAKYWLPYLEHLGCDKNTILIGHSSGAIAAQRYAETHKIMGSVLVGTYYTDLGYDDEKASGYFDAPWNWERIKKNQQFVGVFASSDDPFIPIKEPKRVARELDADLFAYDNRGHFMGGDVNEHEFPELVDYVLGKIKNV